jgi:RNA polymerase sigma-70 factor (ECF subfamily)
MAENSHAPKWLEQVFSSLYSQFGQHILKFILKRNGGDMEAAESVLQDTFIAAFKSFSTFHHKSSYFTWLCKISLNKLTDYYRREIHRKSKFVIPSLNQLNSLFDPGLSPEEKISLDELRQSVNSCLDLLPPKYRQLLHLKYYQQLSGREICLKLQLTPRQLEGRLHRARHALAKVVSIVYPEI